METYSTEEQQLQRLKDWWKKNGNSVLIGILAAIVLVFGWQTWQAGKETRRQEASALYSQLLETMTVTQESRLGGDEAKLKAQQATMETLAEQLKSDYEQTEYAVFAAMMLAKEAVLSEDLSKAQAELEWALENTEIEATKIILNLRLARVLAAKELYDSALARLASLPEAQQLADYQEVRGDIQMAMGDFAKAKDSYSQALTLAGAGANNTILQMKLDNLESKGN